MTSASTGGWRARVQGLLACLASPVGIAVAIALYLGALFVLRLVLFPGASEDDAETLFLAQSLEGGYKPGQPPLYIWLAYGLTQLFGPVLPVVVALKFACLGAIYFLTHRLAHLFTGDGNWAAVASLSVLGIYYLSWDAVLNYSQTVLLAALALAFIFALARLAVDPRGRWSGYIWLGVIAGAGFMTKYNFVVLAVAVLAAALLDRGLRRNILCARGLVSALIVALMAAPHVTWALAGNLDTASLGQSVPSSVEAGFMNRLGGLSDMAEAIVSVLSPLLILLLLFFHRAAGRATEIDETRLQWRRLCERSFLFLLALMAAIILISGTSEVRNHWFIVLVPFPAYAVVRIAAAYPLSSNGRVSGRVGGFVCVMVALGLTVGVGVTARALTLPASCGKCKMVVPYDQLAAGLRDAGFTGGTLYSHDYPTQVSGNLRRFFQDSRFLSYKFEAYTPPVRQTDKGQCLAVWLLGAGAQSPSKDAVLGSLGRRLGVTSSDDDVLRTIDVELSGRPSPLRYGYLLIDDPDRQGSCR